MEQAPQFPKHEKRSYAETLADCRAHLAATLAPPIVICLQGFDERLQEDRKAAPDLAASLRLLECQYQVRALQRNLEAKLLRALTASMKRRSHVDDAESAAPDDEAGVSDGDGFLLPAFRFGARARVRVTPTVKSLATNLVAPLERRAAVLRPRTAWLLGADALDAHNDPFGAEALAEALTSLASELTPATIEQLDLFPALVEAVLGVLDPAIDGLEAILCPPERSRLPEAEPQPLPMASDSEDYRPDFATAEPARMMPTVRPGAARTPRAGLLMPALSNVLDGAGQLTVGEHTVHVREGRPNPLAVLHAGALVRQLAPDERRTLDTVTQLFDHLAGHDRIPAEIRAVLARLSWVVLHLALADPRFLSHRHHPARRLLNLMVLASTTWGGNAPADADMVARYNECCDALLADYPGGSPGCFDRASEMLQQWLNQHDAALDAKAGALIPELLERERQQLAAAAVERHLAGVLSDTQIPAVLSAFVLGAWREVMMVAWLADQSRSQDVTDGDAHWSEACATLDTLLWSVRPKHGLGEREALAGRLRPLRDALTRGLACISQQAEDHKAFFDALPVLHRQAVREGTQAQPTLPAEAARGPAYRTARFVPEPECDDDLAVDLLGRGDWVVMREGELMRPLRLSWISPARTVFLFANRQGERATALTRDELARRFADGSMQAHDNGEAASLDELLDGSEG